MKINLKNIDMVDIILSIFILIAIITIAIITNDNRKLLKQLDYTQGLYNEVNSEYNNLNKEYEDLKDDYEYLVDIVRTTDRYEGVE